MNRYGRTGLRVLGGLLALVLAATLLPAAVYAAGGAYQVDEDSVYMNMEDSRPAALAAQVSRAPADNVTMQLFNYTGAINGQGPLEFYHSWGASVDGDASGSGARPSMSPTLEDNKWPYVTGIPGSKASGSLGYLFSDSAVPGKTVYSVGRGGSTGLFQRDSKGYLYYDSLRNAASYDAASGRFQLYDGIVRPWYTGYVEPDGKTVFDDRTIAFNGNFLPFNDLTGATETPRGRSPAAYRLPDGKVDLWFGMSMSFDFYMPADGKINGEDMIFQFLGDDDVFVYIDGVLVLDIGGTHGANSGSINFATGDVTHPREGVSGAAEADDYVTTTLAKKFQTAGMTGSFDGSTFGDYTKHTLQFFYLERGGNVSYCYLRFNTPTLPNNSLTVAKELSGGEQELNRYLAGAMDYRFRVLRPDGSLYVPEGTAYQLLENSTAVGSGAVGAGGYFTLKAGQMAQFTDMLTLGGGSYDYLVEETMPDRLTGQYRQVQYTVGSGPGTTVSPTAEEDFTGDMDDAAWHLESIQEKGLPVDEINAYNHMAIYLRWCMEHDLMSVEFMERYWEQVQPFMAGLSRADLRGFIRDQLKGQLFGALFNKEGAAFAGYYYGEADSPYFPSDIDNYALEYFGSEQYYSNQFLQVLMRTIIRLWQK